MRYANNSNLIPDMQDLCPPWYNEVVLRYETKPLLSVTIIASFNASGCDDAVFKQMWDDLARVTIGKFTPKSLILPDTIPCTKTEHADRIALIQASLQSFCMENETIQNCKLMNLPMNAMFHVSKLSVGSAFFTRDGIHLSPIGTNMVTNYMAGIILSVYTLTNENRQEILNLKGTRENQTRRPPSYAPGNNYRDNRQSYSGFQNNKSSHQNNSYDYPQNRYGKRHQHNF